MVSGVQQPVAMRGEMCAGEGAQRSTRYHVYGVSGRLRGVSIEEARFSLYQGLQVPVILEQHSEPC